MSITRKLTFGGGVGEQAFFDFAVEKGNTTATIVSPSIPISYSSGDTVIVFGGMASSTATNHNKAVFQSALSNGTTAESLLDIREVSLSNELLFAKATRFVASVSATSLTISLRGDASLALNDYMIIVIVVSGYTYSSQANASANSSTSITATDTKNGLAIGNVQLQMSMCSQTPSSLSVANNNGDTDEPVVTEEVQGVAMATVTAAEAAAATSQVSATATSGSTSTMSLIVAKLV